MSNIQIVQQQIELARPEFESNVEELKLNLSFQKEAAFAMQKFQENDYLTRMTPDSIRNAIVNVALTGLTLNPVMKFAYLVPRKGKCVLDVSYMGLTKILTDTGSVKNIEAKMVFANEPFEIEQGTNSYVKHGIVTNGQPKGNMIGVYSKATLNDGSISVEWMYYEDIVAVAQRSESVKKGTNSPWNTDFVEMARKTVVKRHYKYLPKSERAIMAATAIDIDHENNGIDFTSEQPKTEVLNIDVIDPNDQTMIDKFSPMLQAIDNPVIPDSKFAPQTRDQFKAEFIAEFSSGTMPIAKAETIYNQLLSYFQQ